MKTAKAKSIKLLILSFFAFASQQADAAEVRTGERVHIAADTAIEEDLYAGAREVLIDGVVRGDVLAAGARVTIHGRVLGSVMAAGGTVIIDGQVGRSVRLGGGEVRVSSEVGGDAIAACGTCDFGRASQVRGDLFVAGGDLDLAGTVARGLRAAGGKVRLAGTTEKDAQVRAGALRIEASAATPALAYGTQEAVRIPSAAQIGHVEIHPEWAPKQPSRFSGSLLATMMALFSGGGLLFLLRARAIGASQLLGRRPGAALLFGLAVAVCAPLLMVLGLITMVAIPLSMMAAGAYMFAMYCGYLSSAHLLGDILLRKLHRPSSPFAAFALGIITLWLVSLLPVLGTVVSMLATLAGFGSLWLLLTNSQWFAARFRPRSIVAVDAEPTQR